MMGTDLLLVRHGQTDWNVEGRYQGQDGPGLNAAGRAQAEAVARELAAARPEALFSSDLPRALETAQIIGRIVGLPVQLEPRLREIHQGIWQGMLYSDIQRQYGEALRRFREDPLHSPPPGGETLARLKARIIAALDDIAARRPDSRVVVVTHKLPIALLRCMEADCPFDRVWQMIPDNAQVITLRWPLERAAAAKG